MEQQIEIENVYVMMMREFEEERHMIRLARLEAKLEEVKKERSKLRNVVADRVSKPTKKRVRAKKPASVPEKTAAQINQAARIEAPETEIRRMIKFRARNPKHEGNEKFLMFWLEVEALRITVIREL